MLVVCGTASYKSLFLAVQHRIELWPQLATKTIPLCTTTLRRELPELSPNSFCVLHNYYCDKTKAFLMVSSTTLKDYSRWLDLLLLRSYKKIFKYFFFKVMADKIPSYPSKSVNILVELIWTLTWWLLILLFIPLNVAIPKPFKLISEVFEINFFCV